jgi:hypothetical protein
MPPQWRREHPGQDLPDGQFFTQPWPATGAQKAAGRRDKIIYYQYRADRGRRTLRGIDEQVAKAEKAVAGLVPVKRNRFITLAAGQNTVNRDLEAKARALAGLKGYTTDLAACPDGAPVTAEFAIRSYHDLWRIEKSFRMSKHDLQARPVYHHQRESIDAHLTIVFATLYQEDKSQVRTRSGPRVMAALRNLAICALRLSGRTDVTEATRWASRSMDRPFAILGLTS